MRHIVISIASPKGGVGKTTTAVNIAFGFALRKKKTLLIDLDPCGFCSSALGFEKDKILGNVLDLISGNLNVNEVIHKTELPYLEIIPFEKDGLQDEVEFNNLSMNSSILREKLEGVKEQFDYIILDCPPALLGPTTIALIASDYVIIPVKSSKFSLDAVNKIMEYIKQIQEGANRNLQIDGILLTMYEKNTKAAFQFKKEIFAKYPNLVFKTSVPKNTMASESTFYNKPVIQYNPNAISAIAYSRFVDELIQKHEVSSLMKISGMEKFPFS